MSTHTQIVYVRLGCPSRAGAGISHKAIGECVRSEIVGVLVALVGSAVESCGSRLTHAMHVDV